MKKMAVTDSYPVTDVRTSDGKIHAYVVEDKKIFIWWSYTDDNEYGHMIVIKGNDLQKVYGLLLDPNFEGVLFNNQNPSSPFELRVEDLKISFWTLRNSRRLDGYLLRSDLLSLIQSLH